MRSSLPRCETSWGARRGECAVWLSEDTLCSRKVGHLAGDLPHRGYDPSGSGRWIDYDDEGREIGRGPEGAWRGAGDEPAPEPAPRREPWSEYFAPTGTARPSPPGPARTTPVDEDDPEDAQP